MVEIDLASFTVVAKNSNGFLNNFFIVHMMKPLFKKFVFEFFTKLFSTCRGRDTHEVSLTSDVLLIDSGFSVLRIQFCSRVSF